MPLYLCLDQGGHASRALVLDERGAVVSRALREVTTTYPEPNFVEQDANAVAASVLDAANDAVAALGPRASDIVSAGLATQRSSIVCWDRQTNEALSPVISWQDRRAYAWLARFATHAAEIEKRTGLRLSPHYGASKLRWCLDHLESARHAQQSGQLAMGPLASFLAFRLVAEHSNLVDPSNAQRTLLWNLASGDWDPHLLSLFGVPQASLPRCVSTRQAFGNLKLHERALPVTVMIGDQAAALFASGAPQTDTVYLNIGTGAFAQCVLREPHFVNGLLTGVALRDSDTSVYTLEATVNGAGSALAWAAETLGLSDVERRLPEWLARDDMSVLFLNGVGGLGAPYWKADFQSRFIGDGEPRQKAAAVAESIVFLLCVNIERMRQLIPLCSIVVSGGLANLDALCQRLADLSDLDVRRAPEREATSRGLAWLLADKPEIWPVTAGAKFSPAVNPAVHERFDRWRTMMDDAR